MSPNETDHDILIEMRGDMKALQNDVADLKDNIKDRISDHETRLRALERWVWSAIGVLTVAVIVIGWILIIKFNNR